MAFNGRAGSSPALGTEVNGWCIGLCQPFFCSFIFETQNFGSVQCVEYLFVEFIIVPIFWIINNVIPDALMRFIITDDMVVKPGLPS